MTKGIDVVHGPTIDFTNLSFEQFPITKKAHRKENLSIRSVSTIWKASMTLTTSSFRQTFSRSARLIRLENSRSSFPPLRGGLIAPTRRAYGSKPNSTISPPPDSTNSAANKISSPPTIQNVALAAVLLGFVGSIFTYSLNAVGKADADNDPLAKLKAEAKEAQDQNKHHRRLSSQEIEALESGLSGEYDETTELTVAVAAPAEIAQAEEDANLKVFRQKQQDAAGKIVKKPWWRFGF